MHQSYQEVWSIALRSQVNYHLLRFWAFSAAALLAILLFYWLYGGVIAFLLVCFGVSGVLYQANSFYPEMVQGDNIICRRGIVYCIIQNSLLTLVFLSPPLPSSTYLSTIFSLTPGGQFN